MLIGRQDLHNLKVVTHLGYKATVREPNETASEEEIQEEGEVVAGHDCHLIIITIPKTK